MSPWEPVPLEPDGCPRLTEGPDGEPGYLCGQYWGHDGDCTWFAPGQYPVPPLWHPLEIYLAHRLGGGWTWCPNGHGAYRRAHYSFIHGWRWLYDEVSVTFEHPPTVVVDQYGQEWTPDYSAEVEFRPCGCRFRVD